ncbi:MAG: hypothetical protein HUJ58_02835 [Erysipelotrichaceae bacterium]|nr:hypothetical protein [Erysipelotrichaceae bacterium]
MKEALYMKNRSVVINFSAAYYQTAEELVASKEFSMFLTQYLEHLADTNPNVYQQVVKGESLDNIVPGLVSMVKILMVLDMEEALKPTVVHNSIKPSLLSSIGCDTVLWVVENAYDYWRKLERFTCVHTESSSSIQSARFMETDQKLNTLVLSVYRLLEEKLQGRKNNVYRQMNAGSNGSLVLRTYNWPATGKYEMLRKIPFIRTVMLRTPLLLYPKSNKRSGMFTEIQKNPMDTFRFDENHWICYPAKIGSLLVHIYFHQDFVSSGVSLSNLFELATESECMRKKPDCIALFGNEDGKDETTFYHDEENDIWIGSVSYAPRIEYFGYMKKMALTLHNVCMMKMGWLPIHGAMVNVYLKNGKKKGIVMIGDSGAGKSETTEALRGLGNEEIAKIDVVFDDMGSFHLEGSKVVAQGTETGAFVRLDDLDKGTAYRDMERSIFMNPESSNARVILPSSPYDLITTNQTIDMVLYANNYEDKRGMHRFEDLEEGKSTFLEGKRMALGTTQEKGLSKTYFANPFGPMQQQNLCDGIFEKMFNALYASDVYVGEIYTNLGLSGDKSGLQVGAAELLKYIREN